MQLQVISFQRQLQSYEAIVKFIETLPNYYCNKLRDAGQRPPAELDTLGPGIEHAQSRVLIYIRGVTISNGRSLSIAVKGG
jgi:hypothetical protein